MVVGATVVVGAGVVVGIAVVVGAGSCDSAESLPPEQAAATRTSTMAAASVLIPRVCHPSPEGAGGVSDALGVETRSERTSA